MHFETTPRHANRALVTDFGVSFSVERYAALCLCDEILPVLTRTSHLCIFIWMRTTINLDDDLVAKARDFTGISEKTRLVHLGLEALIQREAALRLAAPKAKAGRRRRSAK